MFGYLFSSVINASFVRLLSSYILDDVYPTYPSYSIKNFLLSSLCSVVVKTASIFFVAGTKSSLLNILVAQLITFFRSWVCLTLLDVTWMKSKKILFLFPWTIKSLMFKLKLCSLRSYTITRYQFYEFLIQFY